MFGFFFCKQKTAYEMRISDWSSDVCSSDLFQSYALYPHMSVEQNIAFPLKAQHVPRSEQRQKIDWAASILGIDMLLKRKPRRSEERRVGKECVHTCRSRCSPYN